MSVRRGGVHERRVALAVARLRGDDPPWRLAVWYGYCQSVALWATVAPTFL